MHRSPMGAPRLYWWWDAICPVCHLSPTYSYTIHTVSPPRPLIPVSRGGVQTGKQTGGQVASLFIRCLTRWAWQRVSHLQNFRNVISMRMQNSGLFLQAEFVIHTKMWKCIREWPRERHLPDFTDAVKQVRTRSLLHIWTQRPNFLWAVFPPFWKKNNSMFTILIPPEKLDFILLKMCWSI